MKTDKAIKELEKMNLQTQICNNCLVVTNCDGTIVARVDLKRKFEVNTYYLGFRNNLIECEQEKVFVLLTRLAETDPSEREEEKKYYLRHKWFGDEGWNYLNLFIEYDSFELSEKTSTEGFKARFTLEEIDNIKKKFNTTLEDFELIEVEE